MDSPTSFNPKRLFPLANQDVDTNNDFHNKLSRSVHVSIRELANSNPERDGYMYVHSHTCTSANVEECVSSLKPDSGGFPIPPLTPNDLFLLSAKISNWYTRPGATNAAADRTNASHKAN